MYKDKSLSTSAWVFVFTCAMIFVGIVYHAYVFQRLWEWFIMDTFDVEQVSLKVAYGITLLSSFLTFRQDLPTKQQEEVSEVVQYLITSSIGLPTLFLLIGYLVHAI